MKIQRSIPIILEGCQELLDLVVEYNRFQRAISAIAHNGGLYLRPFELHALVYRQVETTLGSQQKCSAIRGVCGAYAAAAKRKAKVAGPFAFRRRAALFLEGKDFTFKKDGKLSILTTTGRQKLDFRIPKTFQDDYKNAVSYDSITVLASGQASLCLTLEAPEPSGLNPVGIDLGVKNALVAYDGSRTLFVSGSKIKQLNKRTKKVENRLRKKLESRKADGRRTNSVRRAITRLGKKRANRTRSFCRETAAKLLKWAPEHPIFVLEDLKDVRKASEKSKTRTKMRKGTRGKIHGWAYRQMGMAIESKTQRTGDSVARINPYRTSKDCSDCNGEEGTRFGNRFTCPCGYAAHADVNASRNIRNRFIAIPRGGGAQSTAPEAVVKTASL
jgi:IS605 OrfB family transposase